eukprot:5557065-Pleurochrysis_carterae.AAC.4
MSASDCAVSSTLASQGQSNRDTNGGGGVATKIYEYDCRPFINSYIAYEQQSSIMIKACSSVQPCAISTEISEVEA